LIKWIFVALTAVLGGAGLASASESEPEFAIEGAWVRAMPPVQSNTAAYLAVKNLSSDPLDVAGVSTDKSERAEIHVSRDVDGYTRMERLDTLRIPAGGTVNLSPGGTHLMLFGLKPMPAPGSKVRICLVFSSGSEGCVDAPVRKSSADMAGHQHHH